MAEKIAIDFGSLTTNIYKLGSGVVLSEPTVAAISDAKGELKAIGFEAQKLIGKTADATKIVFPVFEGEIVNTPVATKLLVSFLRKIGITSKLFSVHAVISVPCGITPEMLEKYQKVAKNAGISKVDFVEAPLLSALGQRLPLTDFYPFFIIDMAGGTTNISALTLDGIIAGISVNFGANKITTDIIDYVAEVYGLQIGLLTAQRIRKEIGSLAQNDALSTVVNGRDIQTGVPRAVSIKAMDVFEPVKRYFDKIAEIAMDVIVRLPPEVSAEIRHSGVYFSGEGSMVYGLENYFAGKFEMPITVAENPDMVIALGGGVALGSPDLLNKIKIRFN